VVSLNPIRHTLEDLFLEQVRAASDREVRSAAR
jgi:hypothetical protein